MGKVLIGITGDISGRVGNVVGASYRGENIIRARPKKSTKPPKQSQINQRSKFATATEFVKSLRKVVDLGFMGYAKKMSPSNAAVQDLLDKAIIGIAPDFTIDYPKVKMSKGNLPESLSITATAKASGSAVDFAWNVAGELNEQDQVRYARNMLTVVFYNALTDRFVTYVECALRSAGTRSLTLPPMHAGNPLHVWVFFSDVDAKDASPTSYLGLVTPVA